jgi:hypothetical protein
MMIRTNMTQRTPTQAEMMEAIRRRQFQEQYVPEIGENRRKQQSEQLEIQGQKLRNAKMKMENTAGSRLAQDERQKRLARERRKRALIGKRDSMAGALGNPNSNKLTPEEQFELAKLVELTVGDPLPGAP